MLRGTSDVLQADAGTDRRTKRHFETGASPVRRAALCGRTLNLRHVARGDGAAPDMTQQHTGDELLQIPDVARVVTREEPVANGLIDLEWHRIGPQLHHEMLDEREDVFSPLSQRWAGDTYTPARR